MWFGEGNFLGALDSVWESRLAVGVGIDGIFD